MLKRKPKKNEHRYIATQTCGESKRPKKSMGRRGGGGGERERQRRVKEREAERERERERELFKEFKEF